MSDTPKLDPPELDQAVDILYRHKEQIVQLQSELAEAREEEAFARVVATDLGDGIAVAIGYQGEKDGDLLITAVKAERERAEKAEAQCRTWEWAVAAKDKQVVEFSDEINKRGDQIVTLNDQVRMWQDRELAAIEILKGNAAILTVNSGIGLLAHADKARQQIAALTAERDALQARCEASQTHGQPCYYCGKAINDLAARPSQWGIPLCHMDEPGRPKPHHIGCVAERLAALRQAAEALGKAQNGLAGLLTIHRDQWWPKANPEEREVAEAGEGLETCRAAHAAITALLEPLGEGKSDTRENANEQGKGS